MSNQPEPNTQQLLTALLQAGAQQQHSLELLTNQIGHLTEQQHHSLNVLTEKIAHLGEQQQHSLDVLTEKIGQVGGKIDTLTEAVTTGFSELKVITQEQAQTAKQQAESISRLAATVERQAQIVERLLPNGMMQ